MFNIKDVEPQRNNGQKLTLINGNKQHGLLF